MANNNSKINDTLKLVVAVASAVVTIAEIWERVGPEVKRVVIPVLEGCKQIASKKGNQNRVVINAGN